MPRAAPDAFVAVYSLFGPRQSFRSTCEQIVDKRRADDTHRETHLATGNVPALALERNHDEITRANRAPVSAGAREV